MRRAWARNPRHQAWLYGLAGDVGYVWQWCRWRGALLSFLGRVVTRTFGEVMELRYRGLCVKKINRAEVAGVPPAQFATMGVTTGKLTALKEVLTDGVFDDGTCRTPPVLIIVPRDGKWSIMLKEPTLGLILRTEAASLDGIWSTLNAYLEQKEVPWEIDPRAAPPARKKGKG